MVRERRMKTDDDSGEADEPPEEPPCSESIARTSRREQNEETRQVQSDRIDHPNSSHDEERES